MSACDDKLLMLNALVDGELDAGHALETERHAEACAGCAAELTRLHAVRDALRGDDFAYAAPPGLEARVLAAIAAEERPARPARRRFAVETWVAGGSLAAMAASLALVLVANPAADAVPGQLVDAQVRSLQAQHLVDVATSDRHTVKPWFNGKIAFAPPVVDLADQGYPLVGGRLDRIDSHDAAVLVFHRRAHTINLFIWPGEASAAPSLVRRDGYTLVRWGRAGLTYWAVSDVDSADLQGFQALFAARTGS